MARKQTAWPSGPLAAIVLASCVWATHARASPADVDPAQGVGFDRLHGGYYDGHAAVVTTTSGVIYKEDSALEKGLQGADASSLLQPIGHYAAGEHLCMVPITTDAQKVGEWAKVEYGPGEDARCNDCQKMGLIRNRGELAPDTLQFLTEGLRFKTFGEFRDMHPYGYHSACDPINNGLKLAVWNSTIDADIASNQAAVAEAVASRKPVAEIESSLTKFFLGPASLMRFFFIWGLVLVALPIFEFVISRRMMKAAYRARLWQRRRDRKYHFDGDTGEWHRITSRGPNGTYLYTTVPREKRLVAEHQEAKGQGLMTLVTALPGGLVLAAAACLDRPVSYFLIVIFGVILSSWIAGMVSFNRKVLVIDPPAVLPDMKPYGDTTPFRAPPVTGLDETDYQMPV